MQALCWFRAIRTLVSGTFPAAVHFCHDHFGYQSFWLSVVIGAESPQVRHPKGGNIRTSSIAELPYRIMLPQDVDNLIVASGKSVSTDPRGLLRHQVPCYILGQAGGGAAAVAVRNGSSTRDVAIREVQRELLRQNVYLGPPQRLVSLGLA